MVTSLENVHIYWVVTFDEGTGPSAAACFDCFIVFNLHLSVGTSLVVLWVFAQADNSLDIKNLKAVGSQVLSNVDAILDHWNWLIAFSPKPRLGRMQFRSAWSSSNARTTLGIPRFLYPLEFQIELNSEKTKSSGTDIECSLIKQLVRYTLLTY
ncbi:hypothetical protein M0804_003550 [Polistes exclamans]|nr:hypothetical protein M0804_003550 [Polistes exclamans]